MERYSHLQKMPNSPLTPLTPLSENTKFEFNFGGDGSLDMYIDRVRQEHRVEQQQKKLLEHVNRTYHKQDFRLQPKRYTEEFLKIRDIFEPHEEEKCRDRMKEQNCERHCNKEQYQKLYNITPKAPTIKIIHTGATPINNDQIVENSDCTATPTNVRTPLKPRNYNVPQNIHSKSFHAQQQQQLQQKCLHLIQQQHRPHQQEQNQRIFRQASPVAAKPLCPQVANILRQRGLSMYCGLFQREEIDMLTFQILKLQDLHQMGITNQKHCEILMHDIYRAGQYF